jgi:hypothetical protein
LVAVSSTAALAQAADPNSGSITLSVGMDAPSTYVFRGIVQETDPSVTLQPYGDVGLALFSGDGGLTSVDLNFGVWNSLHTGTSGTGGPTEQLHYEEDFYSGLTLGFAGDMSLGIAYTAYTSPNAMFGTTHELAFSMGFGTMLAPYVVLAQELKGGADGGADTGTYLELGAEPAWDLGDGKASVAVPVTVGLSLRDYYESPLDGEDGTFGFFDIGAQLSVPLAGIPAGFGSWDLHGGIHVVVLGDTTKLFTESGDDGSILIGTVGIGFSY